MEVHTVYASKNTYLFVYVCVCVCVMCIPSLKYGFFNILILHMKILSQKKLKDFSKVT